MLYLWGVKILGTIRVLFRHLRDNLPNEHLLMNELLSVQHDPMIREYGMADLWPTNLGEITGGLLQKIPLAYPVA